MLSLFKYKGSFATLFQKEKRGLKNILGNKCIIEHVGSTAIPGVDGKGIIDIMLVFDDIDKIGVAVELLRKKGYFLATDNKDRGGRVFMSLAGSRESTLGDIHLHLTTKDSKSFLNAMLFRDYLIDHPNERQKYVDLKYKISKRVSGNRIEYTKLKSKFIKRIIAKAKKSRR